MTMLTVFVTEVLGPQPSDFKSDRNFSVGFKKKLKKVLTNKKVCAIIPYVVRATRYAGVAQW